jgi:endonuclease/exonuclease/phosphatase (EEP) superfamily protein YafD
MAKHQLLNRFGWLLTAHLDAVPDRESLLTRGKQLNRIVKTLAGMDGPIVLAGDFNLSVNPNVEKVGGLQSQGV